MASANPGSMLQRGWKRLSRRRKRREGDELTPRQPTPTEERPIERASDPLEQADKRGIVHRGMDRIRRSFRESFRRRGSRDRSMRSSPCEQPEPGGSRGQSNGKSEMWQPDETAVRDGTCSFNVKYLGGVEVFESRGMQVCEGALKLLRTQRRRPVKAVLYVSGDGLRVVDQESNRGLIVDQTIEKVSFCAPDRNHEKGFAYICRDGTSRRWMCHGFHSIKESGERLSHAVGCAFAVCLERKKKRDAEAALAVQAAAGLATTPTPCAGFTLTSCQPVSPTNNAPVLERSNAAYGSFRREASLTERLQDPQTAIVQQTPPLHSTNHVHITAKPRPASNPMLFERQGSLRAPDSTAASAAFKRQFSLRSHSVDVARQELTKSLSLSKQEPILEDNEEMAWPDNTVITQFCTLPTSSSASAGLNGYGHTMSPSWLHNDKGSVSATQSPLRMLNKHASCSAPLSWSDKSVLRSRADQWLDTTLRTCPSTHESNTTHVPSSMSITLPVDPDRVRNKSTTKFDSDFSHYQLPPINEGLTPTSESLTKPAPVCAPAVDVFGQPVFHAVLSASDAFDLHWSQLGKEQSPLNSTNPFYNSSAVRI